MKNEQQKTLTQKRAKFGVLTYFRKEHIHRMQSVTGNDKNIDVSICGFC
jgi:hypothetical protein